MWLYLVAGDHAARPDADRTQACQSARHAAASSPRQCTRRAELPRVHLHRALVHEDLREELPQLVGTLHFWSKDGGWPVDGSCDRCTPADRHRLLEFERFGSRVYPPFHSFHGRQKGTDSISVRMPRKFSNADALEQRGYPDFAPIVRGIQRIHVCGWMVAVFNDIAKITFGTYVQAESCKYALMSVSR